MLRTFGRNPRSKKLQIAPCKVQFLAASSSKMPLKGEIQGSKGQVLKCGPPILAAKGNMFRKEKRPDCFKQKAT